MGAAQFVGKAVRRGAFNFRCKINELVNSFPAEGANSFWGLDAAAI